MPLKPLKIHRRSKSSTHDSNTSLSSAPSSPMIMVNDGPLPPSILKSPSSPMATPTALAHSVTTDSQGTGSSSTRFSRVLSSGFSRSDTTDSRWSNADDDSSITTPSTAATSMSSLGAHCPLPESTPGHRFPFFAMTLSSTSTLQFIAMPSDLRPKVLSAIQRAWKRGIKSSGHVDYAPELMQWHKKKGCDGGVWEVTMKDSCWNPRSEDKVSSKRIILNLMTEFARMGYTPESSYRTSSKDTGKDSIIFMLTEPDPDPVYFGVAFYGTDRIWLIDADQDVGTALEDGIKAMWVDGVRDARVRERHAREIKLKGSPWVSHNHQALISARIIHLVIRRLATMAGYEFVTAVSMSDIDEAEIPFSVYRLKHGAEFNVPQFEPISEAAMRSMSIGK